jgi:hypothetical protein
MSFFLIPIMVFLNRFRGGGFYAEYLPGHPRFYVAPVIGLLLWFVSGNWISGLSAGVSYLAWSFLPWGHLMCLGNFAPDRPMSALESFCLDTAKGNYLPALMLLHAIGLIPASILVVPWALVMAPLVAAAYGIGWKQTPATPIRTAELIVGGLWGCLFIGSVV